MVKYLIGAGTGALGGYFILYRIIGCSSGSCPITTNPYISILYGIILGLLIVGLISTSTKKNTGINYRKISPTEAKTRMDSGDEVIILDVRREDEYLAGHIPKAILVPNETIGDAPPSELPDLNAEILVYCRLGRRSAQAARKLIAIGYTKVFDFGGIKSWPYDIVKE